MDKAILVIIIISFTWFLVYEYSYSAKARVKKLQKEISKYSSRISTFSNIKDANVLLHGKIVYDLELMQDRAGKLINSILEYEYPNLEEQEPKIQEYVLENKYEIKHNQNN